MSTTDVSICSRAAVQLGAEPMQSFNDPTDVARIMANVYPGLKRGIMGRYPWSFLTTKRALTRLARKPEGEWRFLYVLPTDALSLPSAAFWSGSARIGTRDFEVLADGIASNHDALLIDYQRDVPESQWPAWFVELVVAAICATTAFAITDQGNVQAEWKATAFGSPGEGGMGGLMGDAVAIDSQSSGNDALDTGAFMDARHGGLYGDSVAFWVGGTR